MALTADGAALTEAHREAQLALAERSAVVGRALWASLDVNDLDASTPAWLAVNVATAQRFYTQSSDLAARYVSKYRKAEIGTADGPIIRPTFDMHTMHDALLLAGPVRVKLLIGGGMTGTAAHGAALTKYSGQMMRQVLSGGRLLIDQTTGADSEAIGWRRVTGGNPCTFCAMLCSRGPVYSSRERADQIAGSGLRYHGHCKCTAEIVYGEWKPTDAEQRYMSEYEKAAQEANDAGQNRTQDTVLWRMRNNGVFRDSPLSRNK